MKRGFIKNNFLTTLGREGANAFTLAEVLITLGIIGVVSAITIPSIINKYKEKVFNAQFRKAYNTIMNAHNMAIYEYGTNPRCYYGLGIESDFSECAEFSELFLKQLKIGHTCGSNAMQNGCIPNYKGRDELGIANANCSNLNKSNLLAKKAYILSDGIIILNGLNDARLITNLIVDINGNKGPNKWGHDVFYFYVYFNGNKYIVGSQGGCMPIEQGGRITDKMLEYVLQK